MWTPPPLPSRPLGLGANDRLSGLRELQKWRWRLGTGWKANRACWGETGSQTHLLLKQWHKLLLKISFHICFSQAQPSTQGLAE